MGKQLKQAPVHFTIARVQYNPVLNLDRYIPVIQDQLRKEGYTDWHPQAIRLDDPAGLRGFVLNTHFLALQTTQNTAIADFHEEWMKGVRAIHEHVKPDLVQGYILRHIHVAASDNKEHPLTKMFADGLKDLENNLPQQSKLDFSYSQTNMWINDLYVMNKMIINDGPFRFPGDLNIQDFKVDDYFKIDGPHVIMDAEISSFEDRQAFDLEHINQRMLYLHESIGEFLSTQAFQLLDRPIGTIE